MTESFADQPWLSMTIFAPLVGALWIMLSRLIAKKDDNGAIVGRDLEQIENNARWVALAVSIGTFFVSLGVYALFDPSQGGFQLVEEVAWIGGGVSYKLGVDGISILFVLLTTFITPICILASWDAIKTRVADYMIAFLVMETLMIGVFCALDLFLFYIFFEGGLIPMFLLIGVWGSKGTKTVAGFTMPSRVYAAVKFFLYTLIGSLLLLIAMAWIYAKTVSLAEDVAILESNEFVEICDHFGAETLGGVCEREAPGTARDICASVETGAVNDACKLIGTELAKEIPTTDISVLHKLQSDHQIFDLSAQKWLWLAFFASFAVKMPMWPVHTWLPDAHVQAPTAGSVVLAAILLKMGGYGFVRFSLPMFPLASADFAPLIYALSIVAIIYTSLVALAQEDMKKLIAYASVAHMGFVTMGIFTATEQGVEGALFQMLSHGFISGALFLCVGVVYDRMHTREIAAYGGLVHRMPLYAFLFLFFTLGNVGLPGTSGFVGEILAMIGAFKVNSWIAFFAAFGVILSAAYSLRLFRQVMYGELTKEALTAIPDVDRRELFSLGALMVFALYLGFNPGPALAVFSPSVDILLNNYHAALAAGAR